MPLYEVPILFLEITETRRKIKIEAADPNMAMQLAYNLPKRDLEVGGSCDYIQTQVNEQDIKESVIDSSLSDYELNQILKGRKKTWWEVSGVDRSSFMEDDATQGRQAVLDWLLANK